MTGHVLAIDQGTTSTRAMVFDEAMRVKGVAQMEFEQHYPHPGWVEHEPEDLWATVVSTCRRAMTSAGVEAGDIASIGITNQRETTVVWDRRTGRAVAPAIVWQDRRTAATCQALREAGRETLVSSRTGLLLDPYFSASKIAWILDNTDGARSAAEAGRLAFGTVDSFLLWRLTDGAVHATDATNASRTALYNIHEGRWDEALLDLFRVPACMLPEVRDCAADFGTSDPDLLGGPIAIRGMAGDQQAATVGQACFEPGMVKSTYGTGCFAVLNTGNAPVISKSRLLTTIAYQFDGQPTYALEGAIFVAGAAVQWLRDGLHILEDAAQSGDLAAIADAAQEVYMVPAFVGLGAPYWDAECRGAIFGLTRGTGRAELARAALEAVCFQTNDLIDAMHGDWRAAGHEGAGAGAPVLRVDGGMVASDWTMQRLADVLDAPVDRPRMRETTVQGAAYLAGYGAGLYPDPTAFSKGWALERRFTPTMDAPVRERMVAGWRDAVSRTLSKN
ncbi:glycerol kinase [Breoghania corrubedonensis]|uniref:Glycerol kinase n=1 Tax=Breoghania corrubedonensis TaxID=665038 RepID=A0A2T5VCZ8_9HYPH|nr:glycerol kinase GlpK [Breoghania corrubedonensis]PTW61628.1 glycerol kinase [Breoghania corrubedonensis]